MLRGFEALMSSWIDNLQEAMLAQPSFWLWGSDGFPGSDPMPVIVYGYVKPYWMHPGPIAYSYVVLPCYSPCSVST